jgi:hypothetical protein
LNRVSNIKNIHQTLSLSPCCVPEKAGINQKCIPIRNNGIGWIQSNQTKVVTLTARGHK